MTLAYCIPSVNQHLRPAVSGFFWQKQVQNRADAVLVIHGPFVPGRDYSMARALARDFFFHGAYFCEPIAPRIVLKYLDANGKPVNKPVDDAYVLPNNQYREMTISDLTWLMATATPPKYANKCNLPPMIFMITSNLDEQGSISSTHPPAWRNGNEFASPRLFAPIDFLPSKELE